MRLTSRIVLFGMLALVVAAPAFAAESLAPEGTSYYSGSSAGGPYYSNALPADVIPANLQTTLSSTYTATGETSTIVGTLVSEVYKDPVTGFLTFVYQDTVSPTSTESVVRLTLADLWLDAGLSITDHGADGSGSSTPAADAHWSNGDPRFMIWEAQDINIQFRSPVGAGTEGTVLAPPGDYSANMFFATNATSYTTANAGISDGVTANAPYLGPGAVPEPSSIALLLAGLLGGLAFWKRRCA
jgi:hypothetical protein